MICVGVRPNTALATSGTGVDQRLECNLNIAPYIFSAATSRDGPIRIWRGIRVEHWWWLTAGAGGCAHMLATARMLRERFEPFVLLGRHY